MVFQLEEVENTALFLRLDLPSTLICHENTLPIGGSWNRSFVSTVRPTVHTNLSRKRRNFKTPVFRFPVDGKHFKSAAFRKRWRHDNHVISLTEFSSNTNPKWLVFVVFLNSYGVVSTLNFLRQSSDGASGVLCRKIFIFWRLVFAKAVFKSGK